MAACALPPPTFKAEGDSVYTYLYVDGGVSWENQSAQVRVENQGYGTGYPQHGGLAGSGLGDAQP